MYMEMIYLDNSGAARRTGVGAKMESPEATYRAFESAYSLEVPLKEALFALDLHDEHGDIVDTILLDGEGYTRITGQPVLSDEEYVQYDMAHNLAALTALRHESKGARDPSSGEDHG